ncbi:tail fiber domain-containing protein [Winogradskyella helgolandensis]|uniref:tail fiber domain-containing protein n=1 Tax=Winogradskyella helgolandensis TaxID=2697010 RepID=UPI0015CCBC89|nr:tail fiber domain-containing protein [Winogradskyella helgolandensis]
MKTKIILLITILISISTFAQQGINYKAVIKDDLGNVVANDLIQIEFSILEGVAQTNVYKETHSSTTDANGIVIVNIGEGTPISGTFSDINWGSDSHFFNVQVNTGLGLVDMGTTEFKTVPYAINALTSADGYWKKNENDLYYSDGTIGIGTDSPNGMLELSHDSSLSNPHILLNEEENDYARLNFKNNNNSEDVQWTIAGYIATNEEGRNDRLNFRNDRSGEVMTITGNGQVGVGVGVTPKANFHVGNNKRVIFGQDTIGSGDKLMWLPDRHAFRVGTLNTGPSSVYWNTGTYYDYFHEEEINYIGLYSFASGHNTRAQGTGATAMGRDTEATNDYAFASGYFTNAHGQYSTAMGFKTDALAEASTAFGYETKAESFNVTAIGRFNTGGFTDNVGTDNDGDTHWLAEDPLFEIGNGTSDGARNNALTVLKNGTITAPSFSISLINIAGDKALITKEYGDTRYLLVDDNGILEGPLTIQNASDATSSWRLETRPNGGLSMYRNGNYRGFFSESTGNYSSISDRRTKKDITVLENGTLNKVMQLNPVSYLMKDQTDTKRNLGLISQEVQKIFPSITTYVEESDLITLSYTELIPILIKALQEQQGVINTQNSKIETLSTDNSTLENTVNNLISRVEKIEANNQ